MFRFQDGVNSTESFSLWAQFFDGGAGGDMWDIEETVDELDGIDDCGLSFFSGESGEVLGPLDIWMEAGAATLSIGNGDIDVKKSSGGEVVNYNLYLDELGYEPLFGESYVFNTTGSGDIPSMKIPLPLPADLVPDIDVDFQPGELPGGDLPLRWSGGAGQGEIEIFFEAAAYEGSMETGWLMLPPFYRMRCVAADDGEFTLPGTLMSQIPGDLTARLTLTRTNGAVVDIAPDMTVDVAAYIESAMLINLPL